MFSDIAACIVLGCFIIVMIIVSVMDHGNKKNSFDSIWDEEDDECGD